MTSVFIVWVRESGKAALGFHCFFFLGVKHYSDQLEVKPALGQAIPSMALPEPNPDLQHPGQAPPGCQELGIPAGAPGRQDSGERRPDSFFLVG